ncbi:MAG: hypothetical protein QNJ91_03545 [Gammaproteobacteria bacterium]|nr:hypothetical protein [Gammaproteobacteria bacterium]
MSGSLLRGPLPVLLIAGAAFLVYKYAPVAEIVDRFREPVTAPGDADVAHQTVDAVRDTAPAPGAAPAPADVPVQQPQAPPVAAVAQPGPAGSAVDGVQQRPVPDAVAGNDAATASDAGPGASASAQDPRVAAVAAPKPRAVDTPTPPVQAPQRPAPPQPTSPDVAVLEAPRPPAPAPRERPVRTAPAAAEPRARESAPPAPPVAPTPAPAPPTLRLLVEADNHALAGLDKYTPDEYAELLRAELAASVGGLLGDADAPRDAANLGFRDALNEGRPGVERLCRQAGSERLLLADVTVPSAGFSTIESAYWPEVVFTAINCRDGRLHKTLKKRLEPRNRDRFEYQSGFSEAAQRFVASQAYFLKP